MTLEAAFQASQTLQQELTVRLLYDVLVTGLVIGLHYCTWIYHQLHYQLKRYHLTDWLTVVGKDNLIRWTILCSVSFLLITLTNLWLVSMMGASWFYQAEATSRSALTANSYFSFVQLLLNIGATFLAAGFLVACIGIVGRWLAHILRAKPLRSTWEKQSQTAADYWESHAEKTSVPQAPAQPTVLPPTDQEK